MALTDAAQSGTKNPSGKKLYVKQQSFNKFVSVHGPDLELQKNRVVKALSDEQVKALEPKNRKIAEDILRDFRKNDQACADFKISVLIADELAKLEDRDITRYIINRYRYDVYPQKKILDDYPPYLQIEPTSICNFRCVFCYQTDETFTGKTSGHMGMMSLALFKDIIDQVEGKVDFISIASRGEPFVCKDIDQMLEYCVGKFLGLKVNTNASLLNEKHCHALLSGGVNTVVFSADAAEEPLYSQLRVGGTLEKILKNIEHFKSIKEKQYPGSKIITRVSGVKVSEQQNMEAMLRTWQGLVDQVCFVDYNPWENVYESSVNAIETACSDLWRRMFIWYDGRVNPCDTDYKSTLSTGSIIEKNVSQIWRSPPYERLRENHVRNMRSQLNPCRRCVVV